MVVLLCISVAANAQTADMVKEVPVIRSSDTTRADSSSADTTKGAAKLPVKKTLVKKKKIPPISKEFSVGFRLNTDGWGVFVDKGWVKSEEKYSDLFYDIRLLQIEFAEKKHPKEQRRTNEMGSPGTDAKSFVYGKVNNFYTLKVGYGKRKMIAGKPEPGNVAIHWVYLAGLSAGLKKPYYVEALVQEGGNGPLVQKNIKYTDSTKDAFLGNQYSPRGGVVLGGVGFSEGLGETKIIPGIHAKTALHFDFATGRTRKLALETGVNAEMYMSSIDIMANQKAVPYFVNIYMGIQFGKRK